MKKIIIIFFTINLLFIFNCTTIKKVNKIYFEYPHRKRSEQRIEIFKNKILPSLAKQLNDLSSKQQVNRNICMITNQATLGRLLLLKSSINRNKSRLHDLFHKNNMHLFKVFTPEHGLSGQEELHGNKRTKKKDYIQTIYNMSIKKMSFLFRKCSVMIFDLPDVGIRPYTYRTIMIRSIQAMNLLYKKNKNIFFTIIDTPNMASYLRSIGPMVTRRKFSFLGEEEIPFFVGYTYAELLKRYVSIKRLYIPLKIFKLEDYSSSKYYSALGYDYWPMSPNLPDVRSVECYWVSIFFEGTYLNGGRHTNDPFCLVGHPKLNHKISPPQDDAIKWEEYVYFTKSGRYYKRLLRGYRMRIINKKKYNPLRIAYNFLLFLLENHPQIKLLKIYKNKYYALDDLTGSSSMRKALLKKESFEKWYSKEDKQVRLFKKQMKKYQIYNN